MLHVPALVIVEIPGIDREGRLYNNILISGVEGGIVI